MTFTDGFRFGLGLAAAGVVGSLAMLAAAGLLMGRMGYRRPDERRPDESTARRPVDEPEMQQQNWRDQ